MAALPKRKLTDQEYLQEELRRGFVYSNKYYSANMDKLAKYIANELGCMSSFEIGCGTGTLLRLMIDQGVTAWGFDTSIPHKRYWDMNVGGQWIDRFHQGESIRIAEHFDCMVSIEVFEHLTDKQIKDYMVDASGNCDYFVFSSTSVLDTPLFDLQWGHINVKPQSEWVDLFAEYGFELHKEINFPTEWTKVFKSIVK